MLPKAIEMPSAWFPQSESNPTRHSRPLTPIFPPILPSLHIPTCPTSTLSSAWGTFLCSAFSLCKCHLTLLSGPSCYFFPCRCVRKLTKKLYHTPRALLILDQQQGPHSSQARLYDQSAALVDNPGCPQSPSHGEDFTSPRNFSGHQHWHWPWLWPPCQYK